MHREDALSLKSGPYPRRARKQMKLIRIKFVPRYLKQILRLELPERIETNASSIGELIEDLNRLTRGEFERKALNNKGLMILIDGKMVTEKRMNEGLGEEVELAILPIIGGG